MDKDPPQSTKHEEEPNYDAKELEIIEKFGIHGHTIVEFGRAHRQSLPVEKYKKCRVCLNWVAGYGIGEHRMGTCVPMAVRWEFIRYSQGTNICPCLIGNHSFHECQATQIKECKSCANKKTHRYESGYCFHNQKMNRVNSNFLKYCGDKIAPTMYYTKYKKGRLIDEGEMDKNSWWKSVMVHTKPTGPYQKWDTQNAEVVKREKEMEKRKQKEELEKEKEGKEQKIYKEYGHDWGRMMEKLGELEIEYKHKQNEITQKEEGKENQERREREEEAHKTKSEEFAAQLRKGEEESKMQQQQREEQKKRLRKRYPNEYGEFE